MDGSLVVVIRHCVFWFRWWNALVLRLETSRVRLHLETTIVIGLQYAIDLRAIIVHSQKQSSK